MHKGLLTAGAILGFLGVALGAFGAHFLKERLSPHLLNTMEIGVRYQLFHALLLVTLSGLATVFNAPWISGAGWFLVLGIILFSGSLYLIALTGIKQWGAVTPIGGITLLAGWACLIVAAWKSSS